MKDESKKLLEEVSPRSVRLMRRCFMTGKQCIFSSQIAEGAAQPVKLKDLRVFVVMPFKPNLETFYRWSLRPFLTKDYGLLDENVQRADDVRDMGYVVCEKICRKIQQAHLVIADISLRNVNVFYEIGLSYGLERPIILLENELSNENVLHDQCFRQTLSNFSDKSVMRYPGIEELDSDRDGHKLARYIRHSPKRKGHTGGLKISYLRVERDHATGDDAKRPHHDVALDFKKVIPAVVGVAMAEIRENVKQKEKDNKPLDPWEDVIININDDKWKEFASAKAIVVDGRGGFADVADAIESSFCTVVDVTDNDQVACFWLGFCHAIGANVIPVYELKNDNENSESAGHKIERIPKLAFDIRALWYAEYESQKPYVFKKKIYEILDHLLQRDLPDRQKRRFWDRFPAEKKLKIFTGAIHSKEMNREMVGDWDVRTVSELSSYLPSVIGALRIQLVTPLYSPEEAFKRLARDQQDKEAFIQAYNESIKGQLKGSNAIVVASPDVNPVTEYLLHQIYKVKTPDKPFQDCGTPYFNGYVALKKLMRTPNSHKPNRSSSKKEPGTKSDEKLTEFNRIFYKQEEVKSKTTRRGFGIQTLRTFQTQPELLEEYLSQDECTRGFFLLGHLVVARYPADNPDGNLVVLLNGVSGPATFALAQILTGGVSGPPDMKSQLEHTQLEMKSQSEQMLHQINQELDKPGASGVEAIIKVKIAPPSTSPESLNQPRTFEDSRQVGKWEFLKPPKAIT